VSISDVKHQDHAIEVLQSALQGDRLAHGYIFYGPSGVGKTMAAREFAKLLLCEDPREITPARAQRLTTQQDNCGECQSCRLIRAGTHPDYHVIYKELIRLMPGRKDHKAAELGVDVIRRELIDKVGLRPALGLAKVFVILQAHKLTRSAQNAMLKTLEEPPDGTYIILLAERIITLLPTIRSRAQAVSFGLLPEDFVRQRLASAGADERNQRFYSRFVPGQMGLALELFELGVYDLNERLGKDLAGLEPAGADDLAEWIVQQGKQLVEKVQSRIPPNVGSPAESELNRRAVGRILGLAGGFYDDALRRKLGIDRRWITNIDQIRFINRLAERYTSAQLQEKIGMVRQAQMFLEGKVNQNLLVSGLTARLAD